MLIKESSWLHLLLFLLKYLQLSLKASVSFCFYQLYLFQGSEDQNMDYHSEQVSVLSAGKRTEHETG